MYVVISKQNASDSTVANTAILCISQQPEVALLAAKEASKGEEKELISEICIYNVEEGKSYSVNDFKDGEGCPLVYISYVDIHSESKWMEKFFKEFKVYEKNAIAQ